MFGQWLLEHPEFVNTVMNAILILILALIGAATVAVKQWTEKRNQKGALDATVSAIEEADSDSVKTIVQFDHEPLMSGGAVSALYDSIEKKTGKRPIRKPKSVNDSMK